MREKQNNVIPFRPRPPVRALEGDRIFRSSIRKPPELALGDTITLITGART